MATRWHQQPSLEPIGASPVLLAHKPSRPSPLPKDHLRQPAPPTSGPSWVGGPGPASRSKWRWEGLRWDGRAVADGPGRSRWRSGDREWEGRVGARRCSPRYWPLPSRNGGPTGPLCMGCTYCTGGYPAAPAAPPLAAALGPHPSSSDRSSRGGGSEDRGVKTPRMASAGVLRGGKREAIKPAHGWFGTRPRSSQKDENLVIIHKQFSKSQSLQKLLLNLS